MKRDDPFWMWLGVLAVLGLVQLAYWVFWPVEYQRFRDLMEPLAPLVNGIAFAGVFGPMVGALLAYWLSGDRDKPDD